jgi:hypothetical protein
VLEVELDDSRTQHELDGKLAVLLERAQAQPLSRDRAEQEPFRQVRPLVGRFGLRAGEYDLALKSRIAQARRDGVPRGTAADDYRFRDDYLFLVSSRRRSRDHTT